MHTVSANQTVEEGQSFEVDWLLDTGAASINTVDLKLRFNPDVLEATEAAPGDSLLNLWIKPPVFDNAKGTLEMTGGIANGAMGQNIPLFRSVFKAKAAGSAEITMDPESQNLKNDGSGSPEALTFTALSFPVVSKGGLGAVVTSETHPNQDAWYKSGDVRLKFAKQAGTDYSYSFSRNPDIYPDNQSMDVPEVIEYKGLPDGVYYFKVNSKVSDNAWKEDGIFRVQIDSTPPETFQPILGSDAGINSGRSFISFSAIDKTSGIAHYEARSGWLSPWKKTGSPMMASRTFAGDRIAIRAYDQAGNYRETEIEYKGYINSSNVWLCLLAASAVVVGLLLFVIRRRKNSVRTNKNGK